MQLETKRLILRQPKMSDWRDLVEGLNNLDVTKMMSKIPFPYGKKDATEYIKRVTKTKDKNGYIFFLELKSENKVIGAIGLHNVDLFSGNAITGSWVNKKYWRNGYMTEAKIAVNNFAFNKLKLRRLNSFVYTDNKASNATQTKMGYKLEGVERKKEKNRSTGKIHDVNMYGLLKEDWLKAKKRLKKEIKF